MKTYWITISKMEELIENGDATLLKKIHRFITAKEFIK